MTARILVVDDEDIILEGVCTYLRKHNQDGLEIHKARNAFEAIEMLERHQIDLVLTDIRMPGMTGIELQEQIYARWPRCKVIFLSGFGDAENLHSAIRKGAVDFILKAEGYEKIEEVVASTLHQIAKEKHNEEVLKKAAHEMHQTKPLLWEKFLLHLLKSERIPFPTILQQFDELDIPLRGDEAVYLAVGRVDRWREDYSFSDKSLLLFAVQNIANELLGDLSISLSVEHESSTLLWFVQPDPNSSAVGPAPIFERIGSIQVACKELLKLPVSFVFSYEPTQWSEVGKKTNMLYSILSFGLGSNELVLLSDLDFSYSGKYESAKFSEINGESLLWKKNMELLANHLDIGKEDEFFVLLDRISAGLREDMKSYSVYLEAFHSIGVLLLSYMNRRNLIAEMSHKFELDKLTRFEKHSNWDGAVRFFHDIAIELFRLRRNEHNDYRVDLVNKLHSYIHEHLHENLTLTKLSEIVYLNSSYLSRLYKQISGNSLSEYITETKIRRAMDMLRNPRNKVKDVVAATGFESHSYFSQYFKKYVGITPEEFRRNHIDNV